MNPFDPGYYSEDELRAFGFKSVGEQVQVAKNCTIIGVENIEIGSHVRIDGFSTLVAAGSGWIRLGSYIHIGGYSFLSAGAGIQMDDFSGVSQGVYVYSQTDDYTGRHLTNPTVPARYTGVSRGTVTLGRHAIIGSKSVILPKVIIGEGSSVGAQSLVTKSLEPWGVYFGCPVKRIKERSKQLLEFEDEMMGRSPDKTLQQVAGRVNAAIN